MHPNASHASNLQHTQQYAAKILISQSKRNSGLGGTTEKVQNSGYYEGGATSATTGSKV
jgi:hypothetical protein